MITTRPSRALPPRAPAEGRPAGRRSAGFRSDIQGLRAIAVVSVVLYHAHLGVLSGGYVGVDVFFVVSGYLITGLLWGELERTERVSMPAFYGRRARRLLPAAIVVVIATALAARAWLPPVELPSVMKDGLASALYVGNYRYAFAQTDYLNASASPSPFQHFWSLGVEEQFYLVWPLLLLGVALVAMRRSRRQGRNGGGTAWPPRTTAFAALLALSAGSAALSVWLTRADQPWAFFSLPTRAWELGAGGMLALAAPLVRKMPPRASGIVGWLGFGTVIASLFAITPSTPFPGWAAFAPVLGTVAVLGSGDALQVRRFGHMVGRAGPVRVLRWAPFQFAGEVSYSWYLWHWPFLILAPYLVGHPLGLAENLLVAALSAVAATASYYIVESPLRSSRWMSRVPRRSLVSGLSFTTAGAVACILVASSTPALAGGGAVNAVSLAGPPRTSTQSAPGSTAPPQTSAQAPPVGALTAVLHGQLQQGVSTSQVPSNLTPSVAGAINDQPPIFNDGCMDDFPDATVRDCTFGDTSSSTKVVLLGDSHAASWYPAVDYAAKQHGWQLITITKAICVPLLGLPEWNPIYNRYFNECDAWRQNAMARVQAEHPALVILDFGRERYSPPGFRMDPYGQAWLASLRRTVSALEGVASKVLVIGPWPSPQTVVPTCLSTHLNDVSACDTPVSAAINQSGEQAEQSATQSNGASYMGIEQWFCASGTCPVIVGNMELWRDDNHITQTWSAYLGPLMSASLQQYLP